MKAILKSVAVIEAQEISMENISGITVSNVSDLETSFTLNGVKRYLPPATNNIPVAPFVINSQGNAFDIVLIFTENTSNIIVDYLQLPKKLIDECKLH